MFLFLKYSWSLYLIVNQAVVFNYWLAAHLSGYRCSNIIISATEATLIGTSVLNKMKRNTGTTTILLHRDIKQKHNFHMEFLYLQEAVQILKHLQLFTVDTIWLVERTLFLLSFGDKLMCLNWWQLNSFNTILRFSFGKLCGQKSLNKTSYCT